MRLAKAIFLDVASIYPDDLSLTPLKEVADWRWFDNFDITQDQSSGSGLYDAEIIVSNKVHLDRHFLERCNKLKLICVAATGFNNIDIDAARENHIAVCNVRSYATPSVSQHVFSLLLALNRKLLCYRDDVKNGLWSDSEFFCNYASPLSELQGKTLGIIGYGELGKSVAKIAKCFAMKVLIAKRDKHDSREVRVDLSELLSSSDVVSLHCPLTRSNVRMIAADELALMKSDAILINTARGGLVDEKALLDVLLNNEIGGAALDVLEEEPPSKDNPLIVYQANNLIITPHIAWASRESRQRLMDEIAKNILAFQQGNPRNIV